MVYVDFPACSRDPYRQREIRIGNSPSMLADEFPDMGILSPRPIGGSPISLLVDVENVDEFVEKAVAAGAKLIRPIENKLYGDRTGGFEDPYGYRWYVATHVEDVSPDGMLKRAGEKT
jgi:PhnB protein